MPLTRDVGAAAPTVGWFEAIFFRGLVQGRLQDCTHLGAGDIALLRASIGGLADVLAV